MNAPHKKLSTGRDTAEVSRAYAAAVASLRTQQGDNGAFAGEVIWNPMLVCQYVLMCHIIGHDIDEGRKRRIRRSLEVQVRDDGGFGMHPDSPSWLFHTILAYVALRLMGDAPDTELCQGARRFIERAGGVYPVPSWGRIWLAMLGLHPWGGIQPILPEIWLLPESSAAHPSRLYCHMRLIYLGLSYVYGSKLVTPSTPIIEELRAELFPEGYDISRFKHHEDKIAPTDLFEAPSPGLRLAFKALSALDRATPGAIRNRALDRAYEHILFEFRSTGYVCLSPVNGLLFCLALHLRDKNHPELGKAVEGLEYWFWEDEEDGARICGARSDIWDTSFLLQGLSEGPDVGPWADILRDATNWLPRAQIQEEILGGQAHFRELAYGGWGFADEHHPWPVSDCTVEALEGLMKVEGREASGDAGRLDLGRKLAAIEFVLRRQNDDGGFGSYEARRGPMIWKRFNPAEIYGNCMLEYSYTECTGSCARGLAYARAELGADLPAELGGRVDQAIDRAKRFLLDAQHPQGAWSGFWGINFTYGTFFAVSGLMAAGEPADHPAIVRACTFLLRHQRPDGGFGESYEGMLDDSYVPLPADETSLVVQTAWAALTLMEAMPQERDAIDRAMAFLCARQLPDGSFPKERATGCFFNTAVLDYAMYKNIFPTWAFARYLSTYGQA